MTKAIAKALYLELRKNYRTAQIIVIPAFAETATSPAIKARLLTRQISHINPRRSWRFYTAPVVPSLYETDELNVAVAQVAPFLGDIEHYFRGFADAGWDVYQAPVSIELTYDDVREVSEGKTPQAFMRRLNRARVGAGFEEALFFTPETTPTIAV